MQRRGETCRVCAVRVLLLSPLRRLDPPNGDVTYTEQLLSSPPSGVEYVDYQTALKEGTLLPRGDRAEVRAALGPLKLAPTSRAGAAKIVNAARRRELLFREPFRFFTVRRGAFDLVHTHVFSVGYRGDWPPIVVSNSVAIEALYRDGLSWSKARVRWASGVDRSLAEILDVDHSSYRKSSAARFIAFTQHLKEWWVDQGVIRSEEIDVVPCTVEPQPMRALKATPRVIGFFAGAPMVKGFDRALKVYQRVRQDRKDVELWAIGSEDVASRKEAASAPGVRWVGRRPRAALLQHVLPQVDVLLHPTRFDGLPLSVLEAMSVGVPVVSSDYGALPEVVGEAGRAVGGIPEAISAVADLLSRDFNAQVSHAAWGRQRRYFAPDAVLPSLLGSYERAVDGGARLPDE